MYNSGKNYASNNLSIGSKTATAKGPDYVTQFSLSVNANKYYAVAISVYDWNNNKRKVNSISGGILISSDLNPTGDGSAIAANLVICKSTTTTMTFTLAESYNGGICVMARELKIG